MTQSNNASSNNASGAAALSICEALLLALNDAKILPEREIMGILDDAASANEGALFNGADPAFNSAVAELIRGIIAGGNSVRRL